jgi:hypothetical protein
MISSWWVRKLKAYDGQGCNEITGCVPECRFYAPTGRVEDSEVIKQHEERNKKEKKEEKKKIENLDSTTTTATT